MKMMDRGEEIKEEHLKGNLSVTTNVNPAENGREKKLEAVVCRSLENYIIIYNHL